MNVLIFGATGGTGQQLVEQALAQGHSVTAFARTPAAITTQHPNLHVAQGDVLDYSTVVAAMHGQDAVLSALGAPGMHRSLVRSEGTRHILRAMESTGVQRLICLTTLGMGDSKNDLPPLYRYLLVPFFLRRAFADSERQECLIRESNVAWTIARPAELTDGPRTGIYQQGFSATAKGLRMKIARADVADFMLRQLHEPTYLGQAVSLSY